MKLMLSALFVVVLSAFAMGQSTDYPKLLDAYGEASVAKMIEDKSPQELMTLEAFATKGWVITERKSNESLPEISIAEADYKNFNPLKADLKPTAGSHTYYAIANSDDVLIIFSEERQKVLCERFKNNQKNQ